MSTTFVMNFSGNYKSVFAQHRGWQVGVIGNGESWPVVVGRQVAAASDIHRLGIIPAFNLTAPTKTASGTSTPGTYGISIVYRSSLYQDGISGDDIQGNESNIVDVTLAANEAAVLTKVVSSDTKIDIIDVYAAQKIDSVYGAFYRVVKDGANTAGTITFNILMPNLIPTGAGVTGGTLDDSDFILETDNDFPFAQSILIEVAGRLVSMGGITKRVTATVTNGSSTITTTETIYNGIEFWNFKVDSDTTGGIDGKGTYLVRFVDANTVTLVNVDGTADTYAGVSGSGTSSIWTEPNRRYSKLLNPHAFPLENVSNDYPSALLAGGKVPNTNRLLLMGKSFVIAEDYDRLPLTEGLNYVSTEYGCSSHFTIVAAHGRLYWLDFGGGKRQILMSDGSTVVPISTRKIKSILEQITLDTNGDPWRIGFIAGSYSGTEDTIRWAFYMNNNSVANFILELDLSSEDIRSDPQFYFHRYLDVFTYGMIRGHTYIGQYGWSGGIARIGLDNVKQRYRDWVDSGTVSGDLATSGQTTTALTIASGTLNTTGDALAGMQVLIWQENDSNGDLIINPTYYQCRISENTASVITINYVETLDPIGQVTNVDSALPSVPSGSGWMFRVGVIQSLLGPKWMTSSDAKHPATSREISINHKGQDLASDSNPLKIHFFENFDNQPRGVAYMEPSVSGEQVADTTKVAASFANPTSNPVEIFGFSLADNNISTTDTTALDMETITVSWNEEKESDDSGK